MGLASAAARRRPRLRYLGSSERLRRAALRSQRNIVRGTAETLDALPQRGPFDVVIASGVLNFLSDAELRRAARALVRLTNGVAFLELFTSADDVVGDTRGWRPRSAAYYRRVLKRAGFTQCGPHCYVARPRTAPWRLERRLTRVSCPYLGRG